MREILFRGKRTDNREWIYGYYFFEDVSVFLNFTGCHYIHPCGKNQAISVVQQTIGQFTGLTDKNGNKIFEGDILMVDDNCYEVKYMLGQFFIGMNMPVSYKRFDCEVVGNIFDNPELIK